ncbi:alpha-2-macroglobulin family protein [Pseudooceanicola aestuarii]|uniref:alpha-2-macroglobulin family protein n=1 Tax=Pseudooceanicola aestuarii TaxID=2697319 RepID=UPI0013D210AA|nr:alpha-2-macroglobulin family protein [Pseudooceanicola aestuarii]
MRAILGTVLVAALLSLVSAAPAQDARPDPLIPDHRMVVTPDRDFSGADLQQLFDTTFDACRNACASIADCAGFTFNTRNNSCFPKSAITGETPYEGARSARMTPVPQAARDLAAQRAGDLGFLGPQGLTAARDQARMIGARHPAGQYDTQALLGAARDRMASGDLLNAMRWMGGAVAQSDAADQWAEYARLLLEIPKDQSGETRANAARALSAATNAYLRAPGDPARAQALTLIARALEVADRGRDMIPALQLAHRLSPRADIAEQLDRAAGLYGFRITDHRVDHNATTPRICAEFTEPLVRAGVDYSDYVRLPDRSMAVEATGSDICITGGQHGERYSVTFRAGLPARDGTALARDTELRFYIRDRDPQVRFPGRGYVLAKSAGAALPVTSVNADTVELKLHRVSDRNLTRAIQQSFFNRNIHPYEEETFATQLAQEIWTGTGILQNRLNQSMTTRLPLGDVLADQPPGAYALTAQIPGDDPYEVEPVTQWFLLTDLGLTTLSGNDGLHVFVRGLSDADPRAGLEVQLISNANAVLGTARTDDQGHAVFAPGLTRGTGGATPALVTVRDGARDMAFLSLTDPAFDLSDRGVAGRAPAPPIDVFLATDRGAYRAGEVIHLTALARDAKVRGLDGVPLTAILTRPDGVEYARQTSTRDAAGGHVIALPVAETAPRGAWRIDVKSDLDAAPLASTTVLVEDFLPERIDFDLALPEGTIAPGDTPDLTLSARYLFGAPAGDLRVEGELRATPQRQLSEWPGFLLGLHDAPTRADGEGFAGGRTDADGQLSAPLPLDFITQDDTRPRRLDVTLRVLEGSGRPVERRLTRELAPAGPVIGIRPQGEDVIPEGSEAAFDLIALGPDLAPRPMQVSYTVNRVRDRYQWFQRFGSWEWEKFTTRTEVTTGTATLGPDPVTVTAPVDWGRYEIVVERIDGPYTASSAEVYAGWYVPADPAATPDMLELSLDKPGYRPGDTADLRLVPRHAGKALITVVSDRLIDMIAVEVPEGESHVSIPVTEDWGAGAYVTATVLRPMDVPAGQMPARALGLSYAPVDPGDKALKVTLDAPKTASPRGPLTAAVQLEGLPAGETAHVTLAAVDVGILNLTAFDTPDPQAHYFGQRRLGVEFRDLYGRLINSLDGAMGQVRSGGDAGTQPGLQSPPPTEELVAFFTGPLQVDGDGRAEVTMELPEFNGTVRLMALAWSPTGVGSAEADVLVRDPVVVTATLPRFLAPGDTSRLLLEIVHATGPAGDMALEVAADGVTLDAATLPETFELGPQGRTSFALPVTAGDVGDHRVSVTLTTPDGTRLAKDLTLPVRANDPEIATTRRFELAAGDIFTLDDQVFTGMRPGSGTALISAGPLARFDAPGMLAMLDRYPYGCTEQVTSQAMPLLYLSSVAGQIGLEDDTRVRDRIDRAITRVLTRQTGGGAFGLWRARAGDGWLDAYVSDFLSRARLAGYTVPDAAFATAMDNLRNRVNYAPDFEADTNGGGSALAYALMVLAREGIATMGDLRYYADAKGDDFATPLAAAQLGAALAMYGDQTRADAMFARADAMMRHRQSAEGPVYRADYGTNLRDAAGVLALAVESGSTAVDRARLANRIAAPEGRRSTQESVWTLLAAHALTEAPGGGGLSVNGTPQTAPLIRREEAQTLTPQQIRNTGSRATSLTLTTIGTPRIPAPAGGYGYGIERLYFDMQGNRATLDDLHAGDRLVTVLRVTPFEETGARLMIDDALPAGFEIDNPNLLRAGDPGALDWLDTVETRTTEFRADRFLAAVDWRSAKPFELAYVVRAITPGRYHHPAAVVEDMYRPRYRARTDAGRITIAE